MAKIDVIIPVYNSEKELGRCLDSVINQSYKNITIIVVNDGSTDNSLNVIEYYKSIDKRIVFINKKNGGLSSARNAGLDVSKSEYVFFVDSDDYLVPNALELLLYYANKYNVDAIYNNSITINNYYDVLNEKIQNVGFYSDEHKFEPRYKTNSFVVWGKLYKNSVFKKLRFKEGRDWEDIQIFPYIIENINKIYCSGVFTTFHVKRSNSITSKPLCKKSADRYKSYIELLTYYKNNNLSHYLQLEIEHLCNVFCQTKRKAFEHDEIELFNLVVKPYLNLFLEFLNKKQRKSFFNKMKLLKIEHLINKIKNNKIISNTILLPLKFKSINNKQIELSEQLKYLKNNIIFMDRKRSLLDFKYLEKNKNINNNYKVIENNELH